MQQQEGVQLNLLTVKCFTAEHTQYCRERDKFLEKGSGMPRNAEASIAINI